MEEAWLDPNTVHGLTLPAWSPICISLTPITPLASPCSAACPHCERKTTWIELGGGWWSIPFACMLLSSSSSSWSWCWTSNAKAWVRSFAKLYMLYVSDWDTKDDEEKMAERIELWNKVKPFYLPASPYNHRGFSSFSSFNLMWDPPPPHSLPYSHSQEKCQLSNDKGTLVVCLRRLFLSRIATVGYWISFGMKSILYHSFMDKPTRRVFVFVVVYK